MPKRRRSRREILKSKSPARQVVDQLLDAAETDPEKFVDESLKFGKNVVDAVRAVGNGMHRHPDKVREMLRAEVVRGVAKIAREKLK
jgi:hypothetical protein